MVISTSIKIFFVSKSHLQGSRDAVIESCLPIWNFKATQKHSFFLNIACLFGGGGWLWNEIFTTVLQGSTKI